MSLHTLYVKEAAGYSLNNYLPSLRCMFVQIALFAHADTLLRGEYLYALKSRVEAVFLVHHSLTHYICSTTGLSCTAIISTKMSEIRSTFDNFPAESIDARMTRVIKMFDYFISKTNDNHDSDSNSNNDDYNDTVSKEEFKSAKGAIGLLLDEIVRDLDSTGHSTTEFGMAYALLGAVDTGLVKCEYIHVLLHR